MRHSQPTPTTETDMNHQSLMKPLLAAGALVIVLAALGVPVGYLVLPLLIVACPLMMFFMMRGMDHSGADRRSSDDHPRSHEHH